MHACATVRAFVCWSPRKRAGGVFLDCRETAWLAEENLFAAVRDGEERVYNVGGVLAGLLEESLRN